MTLDRATLRALRSQAHHLTPTVRIGPNGVTPGVVQALDVEFKKTELVKVQCTKATAETTAAAATELAAAARADVVQVIGHTFTLHRARRDTPPDDDVDLGD